jgi:small-conductance mechanosensitive channel
MILFRRPYDIGDRIHVSSVNDETSATGSAGWIVKDVTLFATTAGKFVVDLSRLFLARP